MQRKIRSFEIKGKEIKDKKKKKMYQFCKNLFSNDVPVSNKSLSNYSKDISLPIFSMGWRELCEGELSKKQVKDTLNKMENSKTPGNDGLTKEFFETF